MEPPPASANRKQQALERIIKLCEAWHAAQPGQGYAAQAAEWRAKLSAEGVEPDPPKERDEQKSAP